MQRTNRMSRMHPEKAAEIGARRVCMPRALAEKQPLCTRTKQGKTATSSCECSAGFDDAGLSVVSQMSLPQPVSRDGTLVKPLSEPDHEEPDRRELEQEPEPEPQPEEEE